MFFGAPSTYSNLRGLTAGIIDKLGGTVLMQELDKQPGPGSQLTHKLINASGRALTSTAIEGGNLQDSLRRALIGAAVDTAHGQAASHIKSLEADWLAHKLAHALAGCVAGAAAQGKCKDGAIGAAVGEAVAQWMPPRNGIAYSDSEKDAVLAISKLAAGAASAYAGGNAQTAITTAETAVKNNFLTYNENQLRKQAIEACKGNCWWASPWTSPRWWETSRHSKRPRIRLTTLWRLWARPAVQRASQ